MMIIVVITFIFFFYSNAFQGILLQTDYLQWKKSLDLEDFGRFLHIHDFCTLFLQNIPKTLGKHSHLRCLHACRFVHVCGRQMYVLSEMVNTEALYCRELQKKKIEITNHSRASKI